jgi:LemA protein
MFTIVLVILVVGFVLYAISAYNRLVSLKNQVANAWKQIDVQLKRRHDLIPNLIETVKGAMSFERETLEAVVAARNTAIAASNSGSVAATAQAESQLTGALSRLLAVVEAYPDLKATGNVAQLQEELTATENKIGFSRQLYNDTATQYNTAQQTFPTMLFAGMAGASPATLWEITDDAERAVPKVDLSFGKPAVPISVRADAPGLNDRAVPIVTLFVPHSGSRREPPRLSRVAHRGSHRPSQDRQPSDARRRHRRVVELTLAWLNRVWQRSIIRCERRTDFDQIFPALTCFRHDFVS